MGLIKKYILFSLFCCVGVFAFANQSPEINTEKPYIVGLSVPKCGTHLLGNIIYLLTKKVDVYWRVYHPDEITDFPYDVVFSNDIKKIVLVRDLRDAFVSLVYWTQNEIDNEEFSKLGKAKTGDELGEIIKKWNLLGFDAKLKILLEDGVESPWKTGMMKKEIAAISFISDLPEVLVCKFENLVGPNGGGTFKDQYEQIMQISEMLPAKISEKEILEVCSLAHGHSEKEKWNTTFRRGQIGDWEHYFKNEHKKIFNENYQHFMVKFGYDDCDN